MLFRLNGLPCYVGKGTGDRWLNHEKKKRFRNNFLQGIVLDARNKGLDLPKVKIQDNLSEKDAFILEMALIKAIGRRNLGTGLLVNLTDGGDGGGGRVFSEDHKLKLSEASKGHRHTIEQKEKIAAASRGRKHSPESIAKIKAQRGKPKIWTDEGRINFTNAHKGKKWHLGFKHSEETKMKIREKRAQQKPLSKEAREKISQFWANRRAEKKLNNLYHEEK